MRFINVTYCQTFVSPAIGATLHTFFLRRVFIIEDLPVFGYPMSPTLICFRSEWRAENWRSIWIKEPLPNELFTDAWKARVGNSFDSARTHAACSEQQSQLMK